MGRPAPRLVSEKIDASFGTHVRSMRCSRSTGTAASSTRYILRLCRPAGLGYRVVPRLVPVFRQASG